MLELRLEAYGERRTLYIDKHTATLDGRRYSLWGGDADVVKTTWEEMCNG